MFLLNSRMGPFTAPPGIALEDPFFRSYGAMLPSSLTRFLSRALVSLYPPTCVGFGTGGIAGIAALFWEAWVHGLAPGEPEARSGSCRAVQGITVDPRHCPSPILRIEPSMPVGEC